MRRLEHGIRLISRMKLIDAAHAAFARRGSRALDSQQPPLPGASLPTPARAPVAVVQAGSLLPAETPRFSAAA